MMMNELGFQIDATTTICNRTFTFIIQKNQYGFILYTEYKFDKSTSISNFLGDFCKKVNICEDVVNIIPECLNKELKSFSAEIIIPDESKENAKEEDKTTEITFELTLGDNEKISFTIEEETKPQEGNKKFYWTLTYGSKEKDPQKDTDNDSDIQVITDDNNGINVGGLIESFCKGVLDLVGYDKVSLPQFIKDFTITGFTATNKPKKDFKLEKTNQDDSSFIDITIDTSLGSVEVQTSEEKSNEEQSKNEKTWSIKYKAPQNRAGLNICELPVAGEILEHLSPPSKDKDDSKNQVKLSEVIYSNTNGLSINFNAFGTEYTAKLPNLAKQNILMAINDSSESESEFGLGFTGNAIWKKIDKTFSVLSIPKIGIGLDHQHVVFLLDASLSVSPLTFSLKEAGLGIVPKLDDLNLKFYLSGFGVSFDNGVLSIGGGFYVSSNNEQDKHPEYIGELAIRFKEIGLTAIGSYQNGSMWAYLALLAPLGGPPAFFVKGLAAGFGYNRRLILPSIEEVNSYPLIQAATKGFDKKEGETNDLKDQLASKIIKEDGQYFLTAGIKFTSFQLINGFILATVSFGNDCELGLLGLAEVSFPPNVGKNSETKCLAKAQLAIKASVKPAEGVFSAEAQLTNESYILTKECKLTGGFAAYAWFGKNEHSGDFVITLGGYHPSFIKPLHYPVVPRLGLNWLVNDNISIVGEVYFALTPTCIMAGGKLSATYTQGDLRAWFVAYADMIIDWKPFHYDVVVGASIGASYTLDWLFIRKTFSIELESKLYLRGPKLKGDVEVSWYIISFTIHFEEGGKDPAEEPLTWDSFINTFFVDKPQSNTNASNANEEQPQSNADSRSNDILTICFEGVIGKTPYIKDEQGNITGGGIEIISPRQLAISASSKIPIDKDACVRPLRNDDRDFKISSSTEFKIEKYNDSGLTEIYVSNKNLAENITSENNQLDFESKEIKQKVPAALWGAGKKQLNESNSVIEHACGEKFSITEKKFVNLFPQKENFYIQLSVLADKSIFSLYFEPLNKEQYNLSLKEILIEDFSKNETEITSKRDIPKARNTFLKGIDAKIEDVDISIFAKKANQWLTTHFFTTEAVPVDIWVFDKKGEK